MALIPPGPGTPTSGSLGSITYSRNRYGAYTRNRTTPVNPNSALQARSRMIFNAGIIAWQAMTSVQRAAWDTWAAATPWLNKAGETVHLTGQVAFTRHYMAQLNITYPTAPNAAFLVPPLTNDIGSINITVADQQVNYDIATGEITLSINAPAGATNSWAATGGNLLVEMTPGQNVTRNFAGSRWSQICGVGVTVSGFPWITGTVAVAGSTDPTGHMFKFPYGLQVGQRVWIRGRGVSVSTDRRVTEKFEVGPLEVVAAA